MTDAYDEAGKRWAAGMRLAEPHTKAMREAQRAKAVANRERVGKRRCGIRGCNRSGGKTGLCAAHKKLVPRGLSAELNIACFHAQMVTAAKYHRKMIRVVQATLDA